MYIDLCLPSNLLPYISLPLSCAFSWSFLFLSIFLIPFFFSTSSYLEVIHPISILSVVILEILPDVNTQWSLVLNLHPTLSDISTWDHLNFITPIDLLALHFQFFSNPFINWYYWWWCYFILCLFWFVYIDVQ